MTSPALLPREQGRRTDHLAATCSRGSGGDRRACGGARLSASNSLTWIPVQGGGAASGGSGSLADDRWTFLRGEEPLQVSVTLGVRPPGPIGPPPPLPLTGIELQDTRSPGAGPSSNVHTRTPAALPAARTMPSERPNFICRGARLATTTTRLPTSAAGSG